MSQASEGYYYGSCPSTTKDSYDTKVSTAKPEDLQRSYEIFRNHTTAVEVVVKTVKNKKEPAKWRMGDASKLGEEKCLRNQSQDNQVEYNARCMKSVVEELKRQLEVSSRIELEHQAEMTTLRMENEKLKTQLENEACLVTKLRKELSHIRRSIKMILKGICGMPQMAESFGYNSDPEYEDFTRELKKDFQFSNLAKMNFLLEGSGLTDTSNISKEVNSTTPTEK